MSGFRRFLKLFHGSIDFWRGSKNWRGYKIFRGSKIGLESKLCRKSKISDVFGVGLRFYVGQNVMQIFGNLLTLRKNVFFQKEIEQNIGKIFYNC